MHKKNGTFGLIKTETVGSSNFEVEGKWRLIHLISQGSEIILDFFNDSLRDDFFQFLVL